MKNKWNYDDFCFPMHVKCVCNFSGNLFYKQFDKRSANLLGWLDHFKPRSSDDCSFIFMGAVYSKINEQHHKRCTSLGLWSTRFSRCYCNNDAGSARITIYMTVDCVFNSVRTSALRPPQFGFRGFCLMWRAGQNNKYWKFISRGPAN